MIEVLDERLFRWINGHYTPFLDWTMWIFSNKVCWLAVILIFYVLVTLVHDRRNWLWVLVGIVLCFLLADQISTNAIKDGVQRLRPCYALDNVRMFRTRCGGSYGFVSSHAANAFAIAMFLSLFYGGRKQTPRPANEAKSPNATTGGYRSAIVPVALFAWAVIVDYSRPYLGKHYPGDVICGAILGLGVGAAVYFVIVKTRRWISSRLSA